MTTTEQRPPTASDDQPWHDGPGSRVVAGPNFLADQAAPETHKEAVGEDPNFPGDQLTVDTQSKRVTGDLNSVTIDQRCVGTHCGDVGGDGPISRNGHRVCDDQDLTAVAGPTSPAAISHPAPTAAAPSGISDGVTDQRRREPQDEAVGGAPVSPGSASDPPAPITAVPVLADPLLALAADVLDDLERIRIANENRLRQLTRSAEDGFGLSIDDPNVRAIVSLVAGMNCKSTVLADLGWERPAKKRGQPCCLEHEAESNLTRLLRNHPLGPWVKQARGVGEKQAARLLAAIGDPYWNTLHNRPRLVSELWSYAGYGDAAAQVRKRGQKSNWSTAAKMRAYLVSVSIIKAGGPYREVYDAARAKYDGAVHAVECKRCGPAGKPAAVGSPISAGHQHGRALRAVSKELLRDLWREAQRLHEHPGGQGAFEPQATPAAGGLTLASGQEEADTHGGGAAGEP